MPNSARSSRRRGEFDASTSCIARPACSAHRLIRPDGGPLWLPADRGNLREGYGVLRRKRPESSVREARRHVERLSNTSLDVYAYDRIAFLRPTLGTVAHD